MSGLPLDDSYNIRRNRFGSWVWPKTDRICWEACTLEAEAIAKVRKFVDELSGGGYVIQAGGNAGMIPALLGEWRPTITFEPDWTNFVAMMHNLAERTSARRVLPIWGALTGAENDTFILEDAQEGNTGTFQTLMGDGEYQGRVLDDWLVFGQRLSLIWLDVEGSEFEILRGGRKLIENTTPVILIEDDSEDVRKLLNELRYAALPEWNVGNDKMWVPGAQLLAARRVLANL